MYHRAIEQGNPTLLFMHYLKDFFWPAPVEWLFCYSEMKLLIYSRDMKLKKNNNETAANPTGYQNTVWDKNCISDG